MRYRFMYWCFSILLCLFIVFKDRGETLVEHGWFILISVCLLFYAPIWMTNAVYYYQEEVQEAEISSFDKIALKALEQMSLRGRV